MNNRDINIYFEDNNNHLMINIDNEEKECLQMFHDQKDGYSLDCGSIHYSDDEEIQNKIHDAIKALNISEGYRHIYNKSQSKDTQKQLLWDAYSILDHGNSEEIQDLLERLEKHFKGKDVTKLVNNFEKRYPS